MPRTEKCADIEITPEMVAAGMKSWYEHYEETPTPEEVRLAVVDIYRSMMAEALK
jgi:hypothetical protein